MKAYVLEERAPILRRMCQTKWHMTDSMTRCLTGRLESNRKVSIAWNILNSTRTPPQAHSQAILYSRMDLPFPYLLGRRFR